jgi:hypothetical protein
MFQTHFMMGQINMAPSQKRKSCEHNPELLICWQFFWGFQFLVRFSKESSHGELLTGEKIIVADQNKAGEMESPTTHCCWLSYIIHTHTHTHKHTILSPTPLERVKGVPKISAPSTTDPLQVVIYYYHTHAKHTQAPGLYFTL